MKRKSYLKAQLQALPVLFAMLFGLAMPLVHFSPVAAAGSVNCQDFSQYDTAAKYKACISQSTAKFGTWEVNQQIESYFYMNALAVCFRDMDQTGSTGNDVAEGDVNNYDFFDGQAGSYVGGYTTTYLGTYMTHDSLRPSMIGLGGYDHNEPGAVTCDIDSSDINTDRNWIRKAFSTYWDNWTGTGMGGPQGFICDVIGAERDGGGNCTDHNGNDFNYKGNGATRAAKVIAAIQARFYGPFSSELTDVQRYMIYHDSFVQACKAERKGPKAELDQTHPEIAGQANTVIIDNIDAAGNIVPTYYFYPNTDGDDITQYLGTLSSLDTIREPNCGSIAARINSTGAGNSYHAEAVRITQAYSTYIKFRNQDSSIPGTNLGGNTNCVTTEQTSDGVCTNPEDSTLDCGAGAWDWLICTGIQLLQGAAQRLDVFIMSQLNVPTSDIFQGQNGVMYKQAWNSFRVIAIALLIIAGLIMVISQALGFELLDAYTIRKILPRLLIAILGISLSWPLLQFVINFFNMVGYDIRSLIYSPFKDMAGSGGSGLLIAIGNPFSLLAVTGGLFLVYGPAVFTFLLTAFLALLVALFVLIIRQVGIIVLVILAPLAIACYILPNTQKAWKLWADNFMGLMLMFPIISALIAAGHVVAAVSRSGDAGAFHQFVALVAYFAPYFMLPFAFRLATGAISTIAGLANDRSKGLFDRLKKARSNAAAKNIHDMKTGNRFKGDGKWATRFNRATETASLIPSAGIRPSKMRSRMQAARASRGMSELAEYMEKDQAFAAIRGNDDYLQATMESMGGGKTESDWRRYLTAQGYKDRALEQGVAAIRQAKRAVSSETFDRAAVIANASTGTGWKEGGAASMMQAINDTAGDDRQTATTMLAQMRGMASQAGRLDLAGSGFGTQARVMEAMYSKGMGAEEANAEIHEGTLFTKGAGEYARARGQAVQNLAPQMVAHLQAAHRRVQQAATPEERAKAERALAQDYAALDNLHDNLNHMSPENARIIADSVLSQEVVPGVRVMDQLRALQTEGSDTIAGRAYQETRKSYDTRYAAEQGRPADTES